MQMAQILEKIVNILVIKNIQIQTIKVQFSPYKRANTFFRENVNGVKSGSFDYCFENVKWDNVQTTDIDVIKASKTWLPVDPISPQMPFQ